MLSFTIGPNVVQRVLLLAYNTTNITILMFQIIQLHIRSLKGSENTSALFEDGGVERQTLNKHATLHSVHGLDYNLCNNSNLKFYEFFSLINVLVFILRLFWDCPHQMRLIEMR